MICCYKLVAVVGSADASSNEVQNQHRLPVSAAGEVLLSLSLCNADPEQGYLVWGDFDQLYQRFLEPVKYALLPALSLSFESQV
jgi:hypothetical protein